MQLPNKLFSYSESILSKFPVVLKILEKESLSAEELYIKVRKQIPCINDYIEILDALYALRKIDFDEKQEVLRYVI